MTIEKIERELAPITEEAMSIVIRNQDDMRTATELLSRMNIVKKKITAEKEKVTKPLNEALKAERERWKPIEEMYEERIEHVRELMSEYQTAEIKRQREEEEKIAKRALEGRLKPETAVRKLEAIERVDAKVTADSGSISFREDKVLKITDEAKIPREYLMVDERKLLADLKEGRAIPGAEVEIRMVPVNRRV